jgi:hypothetical protein
MGESGKDISMSEGRFDKRLDRLPPAVADRAVWLEPNDDGVIIAPLDARHFRSAVKQGEVPKLPSPPSDPAPRYDHPRAAYVCIACGASMLRFAPPLAPQIDRWFELLVWHEAPPGIKAHGLLFAWRPLVPSRGDDGVLTLRRPRRVARGLPADRQRTHRADRMAHYLSWWVRLFCGRCDRRHALDLRPILEQVVPIKPPYTLPFEGTIP